MTARLVYFAPVRWRSFAQRPHYMVRYLVRRGGARILWVNPYPTRLPRWDDRQRVNVPPATPEMPWARRVTELDVPAVPLEPVPGGPWINRHLAWGRVRDELARFAGRGDCVLGIGKPSALAAWALHALPHRASFYDAMDDFPAFYDGRSEVTTARCERVIAAAVDQVLVCTPVVRDKFAWTDPPPLVVPNGCDPSALAPQARRPREPPVLGFVGTMGRWFDWTAVARLARELPHARVELVGPLHSAAPRPMPGNVARAGEVPHAEAMRAMRGFTVGLLPFTDSRVARAMDPIKLYEYRALGLPVLATAVGAAAGLDERSGVFVLREDGDWRSIADRAVRFVARPDAVRQFRKLCSWTRRFDQAGLAALVAGRAQGAGRAGRRDGAVGPPERG